MARHLVLELDVDGIDREPLLVLAALRSYAAALESIPLAPMDATGHVFRRARVRTLDDVAERLEAAIQAAADAAAAEVEERRQAEKTAAREAARHARTRARLAAKLRSG